MLSAYENPKRSVRKTKSRETGGRDGLCICLRQDKTSSLRIGLKCCSWDGICVVEVTYVFFTLLSFLFDIFLQFLFTCHQLFYF
jgi:hypothetical protein